MNEATFGFNIKMLVGLKFIERCDAGYVCEIALCSDRSAIRQMYRVTDRTQLAMYCGGLSHETSNYMCESCLRSLLSGGTLQTTLNDG